MVHHHHHHLYLMHIYITYVRKQNQKQKQKQKRMNDSSLLILIHWTALPPFIHFSLIFRTMKCLQHSVSAIASNIPPQRNICHHHHHHLSFSLSVFQWRWGSHWLVPFSVCVREREKERGGEREHTIDRSSQEPFFFHLQINTIDILKLPAVDPPHVKNKSKH